MVFVELSRDLFPAAITGILLSAIIAASMSTADSQLLVASSSFTSDIYKPLIRKEASDKETLWVGRGVVVVISVVAFLIASAGGSGAQAIMNLVECAWAGFGSAFGAVIILSLFWRRFTYKGALAGVITGAVVPVGNQGYKLTKDEYLDYVLQEHPNRKICECYSLRASYP